MPSVRLTHLLILAALMSLLSAVLAAPPEPALASLIEKLSRAPHPQFCAGNWDIVDYSQKPDVPLKLERAREPGVTVDVTGELADKIVVLVEIDTRARTHRSWDGGNGAPPAVAAYRRAFEEYSPRGVVFVSVWRDGGRPAAADDDAARSKAVAYADEFDLPGILTVDGPGLARRSKGSYYDYVGAAVPGHPPNSVVCVKSARNEIVYRGIENQYGFSYHVTRHILDRLLSPEYDAAVRREFYPEKSRALPLVEKREDGLAYVEDFESYEDDHAFKLEPRWGFSYAKQSRLDLRPVIAAGEGRGGGRAAKVHDLGTINCVIYGLEHRLPAPLVDGRLRFFVRRVPAGVPETPLADDVPIDAPNSRFRYPRRALCVRFGRPGSYAPAGLLFATGDWGRETFVLGHRIDRHGPVAMTDEWHEVVVDCKPGRNAVLAVDGSDIGRLDSESIDWFGFRMMQDGKRFYVDDVEALYRGDADAIMAAHRDAAPESVRPVEPFTDEQKAAISKEYRHTYEGATTVELPADAIPRKDVTSWDGPFINFDHPLDLGDLVLEDLRNPGRMLNVTRKYKGKIVWITKAHKGDHFGEEHTRRRTGLRAMATFNRCNKLAREYAPKGVVVIGVAAPEAGHRDTSSTYGDRVATFFEHVLATRAMVEETGLHEDMIIYGTFPERFDEIVGERLPNHMRIWNETFQRNILYGQFAGFGPGVILDAQGRCVFRGEGPDGQGYWTQRMVLDRLLDADYDAAYRQEFRNPNLAFYKSPLLPKAEERADGLLYADDFESYEDTYDFGCQPRWGFSYGNPPDHYRPAVFAGEGRAGSKAILLNQMWKADLFSSNAEGAQLACAHAFPVPLADGHFKVMVRRGPHVKMFGLPPLFRLAVTPVDADGTQLEVLTTHGEWGEEHFAMASMEDFVKHARGHDQRKKWMAAELVKDTGVSMSADDWHEVKIVCEPGRNARLLIDGKQVHEYASQSIGAIEFRAEVWSSWWADDVELFYAGDAAELRQQHASAVRADLVRRQEEWKKEVAE